MNYKGVYVDNDTYKTDKIFMGIHCTTYTSIKVSLI